MVERNIIVTSAGGLHARLVARLAALLDGYPGTAELIWGEYQVNMANMLGMLALAVPAGASVCVRIDGTDEDRVADDLVRIIIAAEE